MGIKAQGTQQAVCSDLLVDGSIVRSPGSRRSAYGSYSASTRTFTIDESQLDEIFADEVLQLWRRYTNKLLSEIRQIQERGLASILQSLFRPNTSSSASKELVATDKSQALDAETAYDLTSGFMKRQGARVPVRLPAFRELYNSDPRLQSVVDDINQTEDRIARAEEPRHQLEQLIREFISGGKEVLFSDREILVRARRGEQIPLATLSSGEKQLLRILVETIMADRNSILIDEPELSMHIDWQHELLRGLQTLNPHAQVVVATHSPEIMAEVPDSRIFRL
jgi:predicted ATP-dependent endonuclease of OLD family